MTSNLTVLDWVSLILVIVGALAWGAIGLFDFNIVAAIFGIGTTITRVIYTLVGLAGLYLIFAAPNWVRQRGS